MKFRLRNIITMRLEVVKFFIQVENLAKFNIYPQYSLTRFTTHILKFARVNNYQLGD